MKINIWMTVSIILIISMACSLTNLTPQNPTAEQTQTNSSGNLESTPNDLITPPPGVYAASFSTFPTIPVNIPTAYGGSDYSLPFDLDQIADLDTFQFSPEVKTMLSQNGFAVVPAKVGEFREFYQIYEYGRYDETPVFITTDSVYHIYHLIFDKMLRDLETETFIATLKQLTSAMLNSTYQQYKSMAGTSLEEPARRNVAYFAVAAQLLGTTDPVPSEVSDLVNAEVNLINSAGGAEISPIWDRPDLADDKKLIEVYNQYIPRGHYTRSEELKRYFRAMMWYGRLTFRLNDAFETQRALLLVQALRNTTTTDDTPAVTLWENIYDPTAFIVGKADDLGYHEYGALMDNVFGESADPTAFADQNLFARFMEATKNLPPPQINSMWVWIWQDQETVTKGFRFMGQRFTLDAYVFGQLIYRKVGTDTNPRGLPKGLDFFSALGSEEAYNILDSMGETHYDKYITQMEKVRSQVAALGTDTWTENLYWSWLYSFQPIIAEKNASFPVFMQTQAWARKELATALGSWTELKHDTILYAKQVMAEMGGGGMDEPPHSYVEPNPEAYARLLALTQMTFSGLDQRGLLSDLTRANLSNLDEELTFLQATAEKELAGNPISDDDYWHMLYWGGTLEQFTLAAADTTGNDQRDLSDQKAALIADVATGMSPEGLVALEEAIGAPARIFVILPDQPFRIGVGAVFTYYEFTVPATDRMTDEQWQAMVEAGTNPALPDWTSLFVAP
ncbi:MAG: DUF3160 domain-containing protein [Chloroflexota bacterium]